MVDAWDPFCRDEQATTAFPSNDFTVASENGKGIVHVKPYVLPDKIEFSDPAAWQRASGPLKWNRQQGLYIYRANRLIQWGGWSRMRTIDEHSKLARVAVDFIAQPGYRLRNQHLQGHRQAAGRPARRTGARHQPGSPRSRPNVIARAAIAAAVRSLGGPIAQPAAPAANRPGTPVRDPAPSGAGRQPRRRHR